MLTYDYASAPPQLRAAIDRGRALLFDKGYASAQAWIAGGALRRFFARERRPSDIDVFFQNEEARLEWKRGLCTSPEGGFIATFENENVERVSKDRLHFDLVKKFYPTPEATLAVFDFTVACVAVTRDTLVVHPDFFIELAARRLTLNACPYPTSTLARLQKYVRNGYTACPETIRALATALAASHEEAGLPPRNPASFAGVD